MARQDSASSFGLTPAIRPDGGWRRQKDRPPARIAATGRLRPGPPALVRDLGRLRETVCQVVPCGARGMDRDRAGRASVVLVMEPMQFYL